MNHSGTDLSQIKTIIEIIELEKEKIRNQILQLNVTIAKKNASIDKFKEYVDTYAKTLDAGEPKNIQIMKNNYSFYQNLMYLMRLETNEKLKYEKMKQDLLVKYHESAKKADGLNTMYEAMKKEIALVFEKIEENELFDLAVLGKREG